MKILLPSLFLLISNFSTAHPASRDSLHTAWSQASGDERCQVLAGLAGAYQTSNPDTALRLAHEGLRLARQARFASSIAVCLHRIGMSHFLKGEYALSVAHALESLQMSRLLNDKTLSSANFNILGMAYARQGLYTKSLEHYLQALKIREETRNRMGVAATLTHISVLHTQQANYAKAYRCVNQALKILQALPQAEHQIAATLNEFAYLYQQQGQYEKALETYREVQAVFREHDDQTGLHTCLLRMADIHMLQGAYETAFASYSQGLRLAQQLHANDAAAQSLIGLSRMYTATGKNTEGLACATQALTLALAIGARPLAKQASLLLYSQHKALKNYDKALAYFEQARAVDDSIAQAENQNVSFTMQENYDLARKQVKMASLQKVTQQSLSRHEQQKYVFLGVILCLGVIVYLLIRNVQQEKKIDQLLVKQKMSELAYLNAHKIRGPVASILGLVSLFNRSNLNDDFNPVVINHIGTSARELDRMIHEVASKTQLMYQMHHEETVEG